MEFGLFVMSGAIVGFVTLPLVVWLLKNGKLEPKSSRIKREAREAGRVTEATCSRYKPYKYNSEDIGTTHSGGSIGVYEYVINGRKYSKKFCCKLSSPPESMRVYWEAGKPNKAILEGELINGVKLNLVYVMPVVLLFVVYAILVNTLGGGI